MKKYRMILRSSLPISGYYKFNDIFQISKCGYTQDIHHILIEYNSVNYEPVRYINLHLKEDHRYMNNIKEFNHLDFLKELVALLSLLCNDTLEIENDLTNSIFKNELSIKQFSQLNGCELRRIDRLIYQNMRFNDDFVSIEKDADIFLNKYFKNDKKILDRFRMSLMLYYNSIGIFEDSSSMSFVSLVSSIENIISFEEDYYDCKIDKCSQCKQNIYKLNKRFKNFIMRYYQDGDNMNKYLNEIYSLRSKITHCGKIFYMDYTSTEFSRGEYDTYTKFMKIVRVCLFKWMCEFNERSDIKNKNEIRNCT